jgi:protoheme IX farnesyltransferase
MMLPGNGRTKGSAFQTMVYSICLVPFAFVPELFGFTNTIATALMAAAGIFFSYQAAKLYVDCDLRSAQKLMFGSFIYLPVVQIIWMLNKLF